MLVPEPGLSSQVGKEYFPVMKKAIIIDDIPEKSCICINNLSIPVEYAIIVPSAIRESILK